MSICWLFHVLILDGSFISKPWKWQLQCEVCLLGHSALQRGINWPTLQRRLLLPSSGWFCYLLYMPVFTDSMNVTLHDELIADQTVKKFSIFRTQSPSSEAYSRLACQLLIIWESSILSTPSYPIYLSSVLILFSSLQGLLIKYCTHLWSRLCMLHIIIYLSQAVLMKLIRYSTVVTLPRAIISLL